jgi:hypothetical protein
MAGYARPALLLNFLGVLIWAQGVASAQVALDAPRFGRITGSDGQLREVRGIAGAFTLGEPMGHVLASACGTELCLAKTETQVAGPNGAIDAPAGPALIAVGGRRAVLYFSATCQLAEWRDGALVPLGIAVAGEVIAVGFDAAGEVRLALRQEDAVWITNTQGALLDALPPDTKAVLIEDGNVLYSNGASLVLRHADGSEMSLPVDGVSSMFPLGADWAAAIAGGAMHAVRLTDGHVYPLPAAPAAEAPE